MIPYEKGQIVKGTIMGIEKYGAFVSLDENYTGLIHISEISTGFVKDVNDFFKIGDIVDAEVLDVDEEKGQLKLSIKNITNKRKNYKPKRKIRETSLGFKTLNYKLPFWIKENLEKQEKITK